MTVKSSAAWYCEGCSRKMTSDRPHACPLCCGFRADYQLHPRTSARLSRLANRRTS